MRLALRTTKACVNKYPTPLGMVAVMVLTGLLLVSDLWFLSINSLIAVADNNATNSPIINYSNGTACSNGIARSSSIEFQCDPSYHHPEVVSGVESSPCVYNFVMKTNVVCPPPTGQLIVVVSTSNPVLKYAMVESTLTGVSFAHPRVNYTGAFCFCF